MEGENGWERTGNVWMVVEAGDTSFYIYLTFSILKRLKKIVEFFCCQEFADLVSYLWL